MFFSSCSRATLWWLVCTIYLLESNRPKITQDTICPVILAKFRWHFIIFFELGEFAHCHQSTCSLYFSSGKNKRIRSWHNLLRNDVSGVSNVRLHLFSCFCASVFLSASVGRLESWVCEDRSVIISASCHCQHCLSSEYFYQSYVAACIATDRHKIHTQCVLQSYAYCTSYRLPR